MINLPNKTECMHLIKVTFRVPENIVEHLIKVNSFAVFLAEELNKKGIYVNVDLVDRASILHDVMKIIELNNFLDFINPESNKRVIVSKKDRLVWMEFKKKYFNLSHEEAAYLLFKEKYPDMALIIKKHGYNNLSDENTLNTWEEKIVHYADKRVTHSKIVSMSERLEEGHKRYEQKNLLKGIDKTFQEKTDAKLFELEREIFNNLDFKPDDINEMIIKQ
jgi:uncharacterized protein